MIICLIYICFYATKHNFTKEPKTCQCKCSQNIHSLFIFRSSAPDTSGFISITDDSGQLNSFFRQIIICLFVMLKNSVLCVCHVIIYSTHEYFLHRTLSFGLAYMALDLSPLYKANSTTKKEFLNAVQSLAKEYASTDADSLEQF